MTDAERADMKRATPAQVRYLMYLGVALEKAHYLTKYEASKLIEKLKREREGSDGIETSVPQMRQ